MIGLSSHGSFDKTFQFLNRLSRNDIFRDLDRYGHEGVDALSSATPNETGETAQSWRYEITRSRDKIAIHWVNTHVDDGVNIAVIIQYGHGTGTGGYVQGRDYINPAMRPIFDRIVEDVWRQVRNG